MTRGLLSFAVWLVPHGQRERWAAEWESDLADCDELGMSRLQMQRSLIVAAAGIRAADSKKTLALHLTGMNKWKLVSVALLLPIVAGTFAVTAARGLTPEEPAPVPPTGKWTPADPEHPVFVLDPATGAIVDID